MPDSEEKIFQQNLNEKAPQPGMMFLCICFLKKCEMLQ